MSQSTEKTLIDAALIIGNIADSNSHYIAGISKRIDATGKPILELTVAEVLAIDSLHRMQFNRSESHE